MEKHSAKAVNSAVKSLIHAVQTKNDQGQQDAAHQMIQNAKPWLIRRWSESKRANGKPLVPIPKENEDLIAVEWNEDLEA
jgi:hypothetical protein